MSWGSPPYLQEIYERRYWEHEAPLLGEMMGFNEGEHSVLVQEVYHYHQKYTHHPIGLVQELRADPAFRHLTLEQLVEAVYAEGRHRQSACYGVEAIQIDPDATRYCVAVGAGMSCRACDNLIFKGHGLSVGKSGMPPRGRWDFIDNTLRGLTDEQSRLSYAVYGSQSGLEQRLPVFCEACFAFADKVPAVTNWDYDTTHILTQMLAIIEGQLGILDTRKRRKRRV